MPTNEQLSVGMGGISELVIKELEELDDPEFGTLDTNTGSSRSTVASEETDVGVMFRGEVDITNIGVGSLCKD